MGDQVKSRTSANGGMTPDAFRWSPKGASIAYSGNFDHFHPGNELFLVTPDGGETTLVTEPVVDDFNPFGFILADVRRFVWSPNGSRIAYESWNRLWVWSSKGSKTDLVATFVTMPPWGDAFGWTSKGDWLVYRAVLAPDEPIELCAAPSKAPTEPVQVTAASGDGPGVVELEVK